MIENDILESSPTSSAPESNTDIESKLRILTQEVDEQIKNYIAPLTRQLGDLIRLIQEMLSAPRPNFYPRAGTSASSSAAGPSSDMVTGGTAILPDT